MLDVNNYRNNNTNKFQLVLICDETGIINAFRIIKERLGSPGERFITLIYSVPENCLNPLFEREISILEKRYSHKFYTYTLKITSGNYFLIQELIEAIINSNTNLKMQFLIYGAEEYVEYVKEILEYLNIDTFSIESNKPNQ